MPLPSAEVGVEVAAAGVSSMCGVDCFPGDAVLDLATAAGLLGELSTSGAGELWAATV